jgi:hypothetical protein
MPAHPVPVNDGPTDQQEERLMSTTQHEPTPAERQEVSSWALAGIAFAGCMMTLIGIFQVLAGLTAIFDDEFFIVTQNYTFDLDVSAWGWIHLLLGLAILATAFGLFTRKTWAGVATIMLCLLSAVANFFFIPYYPIWALLVIGLNIWVIWAVTRPGAIQT